MATLPALAADGGYRWARVFTRVYGSDRHTSALRPLPSPRAPVAAAVVNASPRRLGQGFARLRVAVQHRADRREDVVPGHFRDARVQPGRRASAGTPGTGRDERLDQDGEEHTGDRSADP